MMCPRMIESSKGQVLLLASHFSRVSTFLLFTTFVNDCFSLLMCSATPYLKFTNWSLNHIYKHIYTQANLYNRIHSDTINISLHILTLLLCTLSGKRGVNFMFLYYQIHRISCCFYDEGIKNFQFVNIWLLLVFSQVAVINNFVGIIFL